MGRNIKNKEGMNEISREINKDVHRLQTITERFSKVGSKPKLAKENIFELLSKTVDYLQDRLSKNVIITLNNQCNDSTAPINSVLFEWVVENICKNAADAMNGKGNIEISIQSKADFLTVEIRDNGKGISKNNFKQIFDPDSPQNRGAGARPFVIQTNY